MTSINKGIDVSKWQGSIDWIKVKEAGIQFAILRAGFGRYDKQKDPTFERNYLKARAAGLDLGAYHYSYASTVEAARQEAEVFLGWLKGKQFDYPVCLDLEDPSLKKLGRKNLTAIADCFLSHVESRGYYVCLYSNKDWLKNYLDSGYLLKKYDLWLAYWTSSNRPDVDPGRRCGIWQYSSRGRVDGINGNVDLDLAYKDYPAIIRSSGLNGFSAQQDPAIGIEQEAKDKAGQGETKEAKGQDDKAAKDQKVKADKGQEATFNQLEPSYWLYTVVSGDTLWDIAARYLGNGLKYKDIMKLNKLTSTIIYPGQSFKIPKRLKY